ncbi:hypothetical protein VP1G_01659 [Cytospora mali]|uniref:Uncharacterized protein n=1 Tax=Cytospora mali TaxID=578113 RepID=A0A194UR63_CYTMA|nr:hypothetical protein VP1G_01659 [Valsa mali var. pyri (nom. inval.)]
MPEPDPHLPSKDLYAFELWARVVDPYSTMHLTKAKDKLIALAGIAELMSTQLLGTETKPLMYVAGVYLSCPILLMGMDAQEGSGIVYGEVIDSDLLIELYEGKDAVIIENENESKSVFGLVAGGQVLIWGRLRRIKLFKENDRFYWRLVDRTLHLQDTVVPLDKETHRNVYLDSPEDDNERY